MEGMDKGSQYIGARVKGTSQLGGQGRVQVRAQSALV